MNKVKFYIVDMEGNPIPLAMVSFNYDILGTISKEITPNLNSISGLKDKYYVFNIKSDGYKDIELELELQDKITEVTVKMEKI